LCIRKKYPDYSISISKFDYASLTELSAVGDDDVHFRLAALTALRLDLLHDVHTVSHFPEHDVLPVQPFGLDGAEEELTAVGVGAGVGHGEDAGTDVFLLEVLVGELLPVDRLPARPVAAREVAALTHEVGDDAVELGSLEVEGGAGLALALLARAQRAEVLRRLRHDVVVQFHDDASGRLSAAGDVEEDLGSTHSCVREMQRARS